MSNPRIYLRNLSFNWGGHAATLLVMFFLTPYIVGKLDAVAYGIWGLLNVLAGYMGLFDIGVRASVGRHVALYLGKQDESGVDETIRAGLGFYTLIGGLILLVGIFLGYIFPDIFRGIPKEHYSTVRLLLPLMVLNVWLSAIAAIYSSILAAHERFDVARSVDFIVLIVRTVATIWVLHLGWGLWGLVGSVIAGNICAVGANRVFAKMYHPILRSWPLLYSRKRILEIVNYGVFAFIGAISTKIIGQTDLIVAGAAIGVSLVREYSIGASLVMYSMTFVRLIGRTFFPSIQKAVASNRMGDAQHLYDRQLRLTMCFGIPLYVGMAVYSHPFINLWMLQDNFGPTSVSVASQIMTILAIASLPMLFIRPSFTFLATSGYVHVNAFISLTEAIINLGFSLVFVLVFDFGLAGIAFGTLLARLLIPSCIIPFYHAKKLGAKSGQKQVVVIFKALIAGVILFIECKLVFGAFPVTSWLFLFAHAFWILIVWFPIAMIFLVPNDIIRLWKAKITTHLRFLQIKNHKKEG
jgi:O-antigen/teichoic acid export membrane protein